MTYVEVLRLAVPAGVALLLAVLGYWRAQIVARNARRDQYVVETLVDAYLAIERANSRQYDENSAYREREDEWSFDLEEAVATVQLLAPTEIANAVANEIAKAMRDNRSPEIDGNLLKQIRDELRRVLKMDKIKSEPMSLRFLKKSETKDADS